MSAIRLFIFLGLALSGTFSAAADDPIFSGPQVGEKLPNFKASIAYGKDAGAEFDCVARANGKPMLLVFFHTRTRPAFGMTRVLGEFAATKADKGMQTVVIFLTDDPTETEKWAGTIQKQLPAGITYGISRDGLEGPGSYGLNRNATLTILVANEGRVTANSALIQPQLQADGPKIVQAIVDATGGGKVPGIAELEGGRNGRMTRPDASTVDSDKLRELLRPVINKQATAEQVKQAAEEVEKYVQENQAARKELARIATTIVNSDKLTNYGTEAAQDVLRSWAKKYADSKELKKTKVNKDPD